MNINKRIEYRQAGEVWVIEFVSLWLLLRVWGASLSRWLTPCGAQPDSAEINKFPTKSFKIHNKLEVSCIHFVNELHIFLYFLE